MADKQTPQGSVTITSNNQSGGITAHTVNMNPTYQRKMGDSARKQLLQNAPKDKIVVVWATMGNEECYKFASEIFQFMRDAGYNLFGTAPAPQIFIEPLYGVRVRIVDERTWIEVGLMDETEKAAAAAGGVRFGGT